MNIFFYAVQQTAQATAVINWLESLNPPLHINVLPYGYGLNSHESFDMRNGDLLIIFIRNRDDLDALISTEVECSNYKTYLIYQNDTPDLIKAGLVLNPRHYSSIEKKFIHAEEIIRKMLI